MRIFRYLLTSLQSVSPTEEASKKQYPMNSSAGRYKYGRSDDPEIPARIRQHWINISPIIFMIDIAGSQTAMEEMQTEESIS